ncbi:UNVERIFIED_ORG: lysophospholipase L1-like esterase [Paraburkholderia sediminicola]|nr:lysophospholipase L1-like esterase [Paraburkholderia sediminicola]
MRRFVRIVIACLLAVAVTACGGGNNDSLTSNPASTQSFEVATFLAPQNDMLELTPFPGQGPQFPAFQEQTLRQIAHVSAGGKAIRIKFSNLFGTTPLTLDKVHVAKSLGGGVVDLTTDKPLTFSGSASVTIPVGQELYSDLLTFALAPVSDLSVSIYMKNATVRTAHRSSTTTSFVGGGDLTASASIPNPTTSVSTYYMPEIDVTRDTKVNVVVAFGDSITDGVASTENTYSNWPDQLSAIANSKFDVSVVNAGLGGNRWVKDDFGPCGLCRFQRDVLDAKGVTHVIILLGNNDIGLGYEYDNIYKDPNWLVTTQQMTSNMQTAINMAKAKGIKVYAGTIVPFKGSFYYTSGQPNEVAYGQTLPYNGEAMRETFNSFIRTNSTVDGVIDFDKTLQDPSDPLQQRAAWNSGDNLHPNDAGYANIARSIDLSLLK